VSANQAIYGLPRCAGYWSSPPAATMRGASGRRRHGRAPTRNLLHASARFINTRAEPTASRIHEELVAAGIHLGRNRVARLMKAAGLWGMSRRKWVATTVRERGARPGTRAGRTQLRRRGTQSVVGRRHNLHPDLGRVSFYLAVVLDTFSRRIVGWAMETHLRTELVPQALNLALWQRRPAAVIHSFGPG
jgi:putative transposase